MVQEYAQRRCSECVEVAFLDGGVGVRDSKRGF
ncbi:MULTISPECIES: DUF397 domain-containing protein [Nocardia]